MDKKMQHLEMIQGVINRMNSNSFLLKGWAVTLIAGIFILAEKDTDKMYFLVAYFPIIVFWALDSYYFLLEKLYRALYDKVRLLPDDEIDFSMKASLDEFKSKKNNYFFCFFSIAELWFYFPLAIVSTGIIVITHL